MSPECVCDGVYTSTPLYVLKRVPHVCTRERERLYVYTLWERYVLECLWWRVHANALYVLKRAPHVCIHVKERLCVCTLWWTNNSVPNVHSICSSKRPTYFPTSPGLLVHESYMLRQHCLCQTSTLHLNKIPHTFQQARASHVCARNKNTLERQCCGLPLSDFVQQC